MRMRMRMCVVRSGLGARCRHPFRVAPPPPPSSTPASSGLCAGPVTARVASPLSATPTMPPCPSHSHIYPHTHGHSETMDAPHRKRAVHRPPALLPLPLPLPFH
ncbi:hypothetical protein FA95DRAFT_1557744 [Auriscalpium vulgare]|uniref:Uncharacterized protein n=1 Tax=Auriscalpium vulgare TaxID=40419 RepID=A0ACB8RXZ4_9AGAM|nr:hypothetical protein FA95DRAFT_1557744 [Auriscalpium vulgare]